MIDEKKCAKCRKLLPVGYFAWMDTDGRPRRKATCEFCLSNQRERTERTIDYRDQKHELEEVFSKWRATASLARLASTQGTESSSAE